MPTKITVNLVAQENFRVPKFTGFIARAIMLHLIKNVNPSESQALHQPNMLKPYAVEPLYFRAKEKTSGGYLVDSTHPCRMIIKVLNDDIAQKFMVFLSSSDSVMIRSHQLAFSDAKIEGESFAKMREEAKEIKRFGIHFRTPAYFSGSKSEFYSVFPEPERVMMNLLRVWNAFTDQKVEKSEYDAYRKWLQESVGVARYKLNTIPISAERTKAKFGFVGSANYIIGEDRKYVKFTDMLLRFSKYANMGGGRTAGMGVIDYWCE